MKFSISGTDAGTIMGDNRYQTAFELWQLKTGRRDKPDLSNKEAVQWGIRLESQILAYTVECLGGKHVKDSNCQFVLASSKHGYPMTGHLDYYDPMNGLLIEIKTANLYAEKEWAAGVPKNYYWQVLHYMILAEVETAYIACLVGGQHYYCHKIELNHDDVDVLITAEQEFYQCLVNDTAPATMSMDVPDAGSSEMDLDVERACLMYTEISEQIKALSLQKDEIADAIKSLLGENQVQAGAHYKASYKYYPQVKFDAKALKSSDPETYNKYTNETGFYRLDVKEI